MRRALALPIALLLLAAPAAEAASKHDQTRSRARAKSGRSSGGADDGDACGGCLGAFLDSAACALEASAEDEPVPVAYEDGDASADGGEAAYADPAAGLPIVPEPPAIPDGQAELDAATAARVAMQSTVDVVTSATSPRGPVDVTTAATPSAPAFELAAAAAPASGSDPDPPQHAARNTGAEGALPDPGPDPDPDPDPGPGPDPDRDPSGPGPDPDPDRDRDSDPDRFAGSTGRSTHAGREGLLDLRAGAAWFPAPQANVAADVRLRLGTGPTGLGLEAFYTGLLEEGAAGSWDHLPLGGASLAFGFDDGVVAPRLHLGAAWLHLGPGEDLWAFDTGPAVDVRLAGDVFLDVSGSLLLFDGFGAVDGGAGVSFRFDPVYVRAGGRVLWLEGLYAGPQFAMGARF